LNDTVLPSRYAEIHRDFVPEMLLQKGAVQRHYEIGSRIPLEEMETGILFISYGVVKVSLSQINQEDVFLYLLCRGDVYGQGIKTVYAGKTTAKALTKCVIIYLPERELHAFMLKGSPLNAYLLGALSRTIQQQSFQHLRNVRYDIRTRVKLFLRDYANTFGVKNSDPLTIQNYLSHTEIAQLLCSSRQTISTIFNHWKAKKQIAYTRNQIRILDPDFFGK